MLCDKLGDKVGRFTPHDQQDSMAERRAALERWADFILACEAGRPWLPQGDNVTPFRKAEVA